MSTNANWHYWMGGKNKTTHFSGKCKCSAIMEHENYLDTIYIIPGVNQKILSEILLMTAQKQEMRNEKMST